MAVEQVAQTDRHPHLERFAAQRAETARLSRQRKFRLVLVVGLHRGAMSILMGAPATTGRTDLTSLPATVALVFLAAVDALEPQLEYLAKHTDQAAAAHMIALQVLAVQALPA